MKNKFARILALSLFLIGTIAYVSFFYNNDIAGDTINPDSEKSGGNCLMGKI